MTTDTMSISPLDRRRIAMACREQAEDFDLSAMNASVELAKQLKKKGKKRKPEAELTELAEGISKIEDEVAEYHRIADLMEDAEA